METNAKQTRDEFMGLNAKHTPGPWIVEDRTGAFGRVDIVGGVAKYTVAIAQGDNGKDLAEANARLIAAAPDMEAALLLFLEVEHEHHGDMPVFLRAFTNAARAAISKSVK